MYFNLHWKYVLLPLTYIYIDVNDTKRRKKQNVANWFYLNDVNIIKDLQKNI